MTLPKIKTALVAKLASIAVHAIELLENRPYLEQADPMLPEVARIVQLLDDPEVKALLAHPAMQVFLPRKRKP